MPVTKLARSYITQLRDWSSESAFESLLISGSRFGRSFHDVYQFLQRQNHRPFIKRYLKREEIQRALGVCDNSLNDALNMFNVSEPPHCDSDRRVQPADSIASSFLSKSAF